jgi:hypothetical protein
MAESNRSAELDQVRQMLFPKLSAEEGWERIDAALEGASDPEHAAAIERVAAEPDLIAVLVQAIRKLGDRLPE